MLTNETYSGCCERVTQRLTADPEVIVNDDLVQTIGTRHLTIADVPYSVDRLRGYDGIGLIMAGFDALHWHGTSL